MKIAIVMVLALVVTLPVVAPANAQAPVPGVYKSTDLGGTMLPGRYSESWSVANGSLMVGNTTNSQSWDGFSLGTQWTMSCAQVSAAPGLLQDTVDGNGNGIRQYQVNFTGGVGVFDGAGPWGGGSPSYTAPFMYYSEVQTYHYANNQVFAVLSTVQMQAEFDGYSDCMTLSISNKEEQGTTDADPTDPNYPSFLDPACGATRTLGSWGDAYEFTLVISGSCTIPTEQSTWSRIKAMYKGN